MKRFLRSESLRLSAGAVIVAAMAAPPALAQEHQVTGAGATLFVDVFDNNPALTNDWIDVDGDGNFGFYDDPNDPDNVPDSVDQLAPAFPGGYWIIQYRSVGSVEGFSEFVTFQLCGDLPESIPSERGLINGLRWADLAGNPAVPTCVANAAVFGTGCTNDAAHDNDGITPQCTPRCNNSIDFANTDVPSALVVQGPAGQSSWNAKPANDGYGRNPAPSNRGSATAGGQSNMLATLSPACANGAALNTNVESPDANTLYDTPVAWSPVAFIANRGTVLDIDNNGVEDGAIAWGDLQHGYVTGRRQNGENLVFVTRDVGSGTRNAAMNSIGVDPSQGVGDNIGLRLAGNNTPGPNYQATNMAGSGDMENAVQSNRLAIGYTGVFGSSRSVADARNGLYELIGVRKAAQVVRVSLDAILDNCDPNTGWQIGGIQTLITRGNPRAHDFGVRAPARESGPLMGNVFAAQFLRNLQESIAAVTLPLPPEAFNMPGETLARRTTLVAAVDCVPLVTDPTAFQTNGALNASVQQYTRENNSIRPGGSLEVLPYGDNDAAGVISTAGRTPNRRAPVSGTYRDGGTTAYRYIDGAGQPQTLAGGSTRLSQRNRVQGDFNNDGRRNINDIEKLVEAHYLFSTQPTDVALATFEPIQAGGNLGSMTVNRLIVHVAGDFNSDGEFDAQDIRYFADGLALDATTFRLNRAAAFTRADSAWLARTGNDNNLFDTVLATGAAYRPGDSRGDLTGSTVGPAPGSSPTGANGVINAADIDYVCDNLVSDWTNTSLAQGRDLSADLDGDLDVDGEDVRVLVEDILRTSFGDANLDGVVDAADEAIVLAHLGQAGGWAQGDFDCDGVVTQADLEVITGGGCGTFLRGDADGSGAVNNFDIDSFVLAISNPDAYTAQYCGGDANCTICRNDLDGSGAVNNFDIDAFVACLNSLPAPGQACP